MKTRCPDCVIPATGPIPDYLVGVRCVSCGGVLSLMRVAKAGRPVEVDAIPRHYSYPSLGPIVVRAVS